MRKIVEGIYLILLVAAGIASACTNGFVSILVVLGLVGAFLYSSISAIITRMSHIYR